MKRVEQNRLRDERKIAVNPRFPTWASRRPVHLRRIGRSALQLSIELLHMVRP